jgi:hypothetical protein
MLGLVAVVALVALVLVFSQNNAATQQAALDNAAAQQQAIDSAKSANTSAAQASQAAAGAESAARPSPGGADQSGQQDQPVNPAPQAGANGQGSPSAPPGQ